MRQLRNKKSWILEYEEAKEFTDELEIAYEFFKEGEFEEIELEKLSEKAINAIEKLEFKNMLSEEGDDLNAVLQITSGAGGTESCDWASMMMRMYVMWAEKHGHKVKQLNLQEGDVAGIKTVTL